MVPGIDGVGRREDGRLVCFVADDELVGPMATRTVIDSRHSVVLPDGADVVKIAAGMNPAMSSWVVLRRRVPIEAGQSVLILGATGNAGQMAVQIAKRLGAGRDQARLAALPWTGADATVALTDDADATAAALARAASEVDLVIDHLWGRPAGDTITALLRARADRSRALNWIQIGAIAGPTIELPSVALRSANFRLQGNGQGAVSTGRAWRNCPPSSMRSKAAVSRSPPSLYPSPTSKACGPLPRSGACAPSWCPDPCRAVCTR
ncbi:zinc-binding alcohol dehydrogenase family protein [Streptomyces milbemycinicus]|uniref:zinc-binding alcohol dehydrogenase family protein n=1 Tax=Streptomyces milbemycinicus TaxID=476552 RepID=UPI0033C8D5B6